MEESQAVRRGLGSVADARTLLEGLFEHAPVAYQVYRADGHCLLVNQAFRDLFGTGPPPEYNVLEDDELARRGVLALIHRAFAGETIHIPPHWYDPEQLRQVDIPGARKVGVEVTLFPLRGDGGRIEHIAMCFKDVAAELERARERDQLEATAAALRKSEEALTRNAARLQILAESSRQFSAATPDLSALLQLVARRIGEVIGDMCVVRLIARDGEWLETASTVFHPDPDLKAAADEIMAMPQRVGEGVLGRVAQTGQAMLVCDFDPAGELTPERFRAHALRLGICSVMAVPLRSRERLLGAFSMCRTSPGRPYTEDDLQFAQDLADRGALAIENAILLAELEERVSRRTAALAEANHELEAFSYSVSHDLRTPLRAIDGFSEALLFEYGEQLDERARDYLHRVRNGAHRMAALIDDLLDLARIHRSQVQRQAVDLSDLAGRVMEDIRRGDPERRVEVVIGAGLKAHADPRLMTIVLDNLLGNAWKFTARRPDARIVFDRTADGTAFYVRDNGVGFDMAYMNKLFLPFQRLHRDGEYEGTGIGLATVHRIISRHGGRVWAEAVPGEGAIFHFTVGSVRP